MSQKLTREERIIKAKLDLQKDHPFFGYLLVKLGVKEMKDLGKSGGAMGTDGYYIYFDPEDPNFDKLSQDNIKFIVAHEVLHCALEHLSREGDRDKWIFNAACDYAVNLMLTESGLPMPNIGLLDKKYQGMFAEQIYDQLMQECKKQPGMKITIQCSGGKKSDDKQGGQSQVLEVHLQDTEATKGMTPEQKKEAANEWGKLLVEAANWAQQQGKLPAGLERLVDSLIFKPATWTEQLQRIVEQIVGQDDFTYARPSKRTWVHGIYIPSMTSEKLEVAVGIDTSGSISHDMLRDFLSEIESMRNKYPRVHLTLYPVDAAVYESFEVENGDCLEEKADGMLRGGGGTDFRPLFELFEDPEVGPPKMLIFFTDGYATYPEEPPDYPVVWLVTRGGEVPPFGEHVEIDNPHE